MNNVPVEATINGFFLIAILALVAILILVRLTLWGRNLYRKHVRGEYVPEQHDEY